MDSDDDDNNIQDFSHSNVYPQQVDTEYQTTENPTSKIQNETLRFQDKEKSQKTKRSSLIPNSFFSVSNKFRRLDIKPKSEEGIDNAESITTQTFQGALLELVNIAKVDSDINKDTAAKLGFYDQLIYTIENRIATNPHFPFYMIAAISLFFLTLYAFSWYYVSQINNNREEIESLFGGNSLNDAFYLTVQVLLSAGFEDTPDINYGSLRIVYFLMLFTGLVVFAILLGFITDSITQFMTALADGRTKVVENGHTLILGWSEATPRVIIQLSFLRRQYQTLNEEYYSICGISYLYYLPWLSILFKLCGLLYVPSTPAAASDIVILAKTKTKTEMHELLEIALEERGIVPIRTKLGQNIVCRVGDPTDCHDLIRVGAHKAASIITMMVERDREESDMSGGELRNGATTRTILALRQVIFTYEFSKEKKINPDLRIVLLLSEPSFFIDAACFRNSTGFEVTYPVDVSLFLNTLIFKCVAQPGLATIIMDMLDFEGKSIRRRKSQNMYTKNGNDENYPNTAIGLRFADLQKQFPFAIMIGLIPSSCQNSLELTINHYGLCPDPNHTIQYGDLIVFIGQRSTPIIDPGHEEKVRMYRSKALMKKKSRRASVKYVDEKVNRNTIICGWRLVWNRDSKRLRKQIVEIANCRSPGSLIIFVNGLEFDEFATVMKECEFEPVMEKDFIKTKFNFEIKEVSYDRRLYMIGDGIIISHVYGDAGSPKVMCPIIFAQNIHTAIIFGTQAKVDYPPRSRDTRVMSITLLLRKCQQIKNDNSAPMHIVGENEEDNTAKVVLAPPVEFDDKGRIQPGHYVPDFINTQAIYARVLTQVLAYPLIKPAMDDLFQDSPGSCNLDITPASRYVPLGMPLSFGEVQEFCLMYSSERCICIGYVEKNGHLECMPPYDAEIETGFTMHDRLVVLRRDMEELEKLIQDTQNETLNAQKI